MALLTEGRFKVEVTSAGLRRKGASNLLCLSVYFKAFEGKDGDEYIPIEDDFGIIDDIYLEKKPENGGGLIEDVVKRIGHVFDWQGDLSTLADTVTGKRCKITVGMRTYNGKTTPEVKWINHINDGDGGGFTIESDPAIAKQAQAQYGAKARAILGVSSTPSRPAAHATTRTAPPKPAPSKQQATEDTVWEQFVARMNSEGVEVSEHEKAWFYFLGEACNAKDGSEVTDWNAASEALTTWVFIPF